MVSVSTGWQKRAKKKKKQIQEEQDTLRVRSTTHLAITFSKLSLDLHLGNRIMMVEQRLWDDKGVALRVSAERGSLEKHEELERMTPVRHKRRIPEGPAAKISPSNLPFLSHPQKVVSQYLENLTICFDCADHNKLWKILKEMGIPDHLTCLLRNLYAGQEATDRTGHGTTDWFQIGKGVHQGWISNLTYMQSTSWETLGWKKHKLELRLPGEISKTSDMQMTPPLWQKAKKN